MDGSMIEHSDSDSGESWTLLENNLTCCDDTPDISENTAPPVEREHADNHSEKDDDTDGISVISDSEPEATPYNVNNGKISSEETSPAEQDTPLLVGPPQQNTKNNIDSIREETDFLGDNVKYKTYVHRRNPKVSTILDVIMLGTFVITAGMALGHLWSCKNECTTQSSVNKILSNLYKLQEENAYLRSKLKEITDATSHQLEHQRNFLNNKVATKEYRCKKIFEEPVIKNDKMEMAVKCVDDKRVDDVLHDSLTMPEHEKEFLNDVDRMKENYQNKEQLHKEIKKQDFEKLQNHGKPDLDKQLEPIFIPLNLEQSDVIKNTVTGKSHRQINLELQLGTNQHTNSLDPNIQTDQLESLPEKKITYADSLKTDQPFQRIQRSDNTDKPSRWIKDHSGKRKRKDESILLNLNSFSEDDIIKDNRYTGPKIKHDKKKHDRQKPHKKQKRNNKYEQWEMKGGYLKDFDEFSVTSSQDNEILINHPEQKFLNPVFENYINKFIENESNASNENLPKIAEKIDENPNTLDKHSLKREKKKRKVKDSEWYDRRSALRAEARTKLEHELFGENTPNNAAWYFRRMQKREQCRAKKNNSTFKKSSKKKMNFKMKL